MFYFCFDVNFFGLTKALKVDGLRIQPTNL
jgi:hypothetical protein